MEVMCHILHLILFTNPGCFVQAETLTESKCLFFFLSWNKLFEYLWKIPPNRQVSPGKHLALLNTTQRPAGCHSVKSNDLIRLMTCQSNIKDDAQGRAELKIWRFFLSVMKEHHSTEQNAGKQQNRTPIKYLPPIHHAYKKSCISSGQTPYPTTTFSESLSNTKCITTLQRRQWTWIGLAL